MDGTRTPQAPRPGAGPLAGVTVVDLGQIYNGPYATFLMAMAGARVIKVEPVGGENLRRRAAVGGAAVPFAMLNSNKQFVTLNLKTAAGKDLFLRMVDRADVLVENFSVGAMERLGLGYEDLRVRHPGLVYASGSGYGRSGPMKAYPAMDIAVQAMSGLMSINGFEDRPPVKVGPAVADFMGGVHLYAAITTALFERERTGLGQAVEVSMMESVYASLASNLGLYYASQGVSPPAPATAMAAWPSLRTTPTRRRTATSPSWPRATTSGGGCWWPSAAPSWWATLATTRSRPAWPEWPRSTRSSSPSPGRAAATRPSAR